MGEKTQLITILTDLQAKITVTLDLSFGYGQSCYKSSIKMVLQNMMTKNHIAEVLFLPVHSEINNCCFPVKTIRDSF